MGIFANLPDEIVAMRYHSMVLERESFPQSLNITCETNDEEKLIMGLENSQEKIFGVQFHPESIGTKFGKKILTNFLAQ
jgi:anthranilate/para-aminobenzoate synthase component II